jgi:tetratricopeptide (TPR) repeat protein
MWESSITCFVTVATVEPSNYPVSEWLAKAYFQIGKYDAAIELFEKVTKKDNRIWPDLGFAYETKGDMNGAIYAYEMGGQGSEIWRTIRLGRRYALNSDYDKEIEVFEKAVQKNPTAWWAWQYLGEAYEAQGYRDGVRKVYERAVHTNPSAEWSLVGLWKAVRKTHQQAPTGTF